MSLTPAAADLLESLPGMVPDLTLFVVDDHGRIAHRWGGDLATSFECVGAGPQVRCAADRAVLAAELPGGAGHLFATLPQDEDPVSRRLLQRILDAAAQRERIERDLDSMNVSSLQLLEQVSMLGETLPRLSAGESDAVIAAMGLRGLLVAAGVERAVYVQLHAETQRCEVLVHVVLDGSGQAELLPVDQAALPPAVGLLADALAAEDGGVAMCTKRELDASLAADALERLARHDALGVPVSYGSGEQRVLLGALLLMDKRDTGYGEVPRPDRDLRQRRRQLGSEEGQVALSFAAMLGAVLGARKVAELGKELSLAQAIQGQILPSQPAMVAGFELAGDYRTCGDVGGDYFDFVPLADGRTMVVVADVSGHNLASGMMMVSARATIRTLATQCTDPADLFRRLAAVMYQDLSRTERFFTAAAAVLRPGESSVEVVIAGHNELMLFRAADGSVQPIAGEGTVLGFLPQASYRSQTLRLQPGDLLLLYTDGVTEACGADGEMFGEQRLARVLAGTGGRGAEAVIAAVLAAVRDFAADSRGDDVTVVAIRAVASTEVRS